MIYQQGCFIKGTNLYVDEDMAESNRGVQILVIFDEIMVVTFCDPSRTHLNSMVSYYIFENGLATLIVGVDLISRVEKPSFKLIWKTNMDI